LAYADAQSRQFGQIGLEILRINDDRRGPGIALMEDREEIAFRTLGQIANRAAHSDVASVNDKLPGYADTSLWRCGKCGCGCERQHEAGDEERDTKNARGHANKRHKSPVTKRAEKG
jgi:hypothetical protein